MDKQVSIDIVQEPPAVVLEPPAKRSRLLRSRKESVHYLKRHLEVLPSNDNEQLPTLPKTRAQCLSMPRPCPFVSCSHHLFLDVSKQNGTIQYNFPELEVWELKETCSLDVADRGGITLEDTGGLMNVTRERVRQMEAKALGKCAKHLDGPRELYEKER